MNDTDKRRIENQLKHIRAEAALAEQALSAGLSSAAVEKHVEQIVKAANTVAETLGGHGSGK